MEVDDEMGEERKAQISDAKRRKKEKREKRKKRRKQKEAEASKTVVSEEELKTPRKKRTVKTAKGLNVEMTIPEGTNGIRLRLRSSEGKMLGTLLIRDRGVKIMKANSKTPPKSSISWSVLPKLHDLNFDLMMDPESD